MSGESGDSKNIDVTWEQNGGVLKEILVEGSSTESPPKAVKVTVHYVGKLTDGKKFDSSRDRGEPFEFTLGRGQVIRGWDVGVATMKRGEKCLLTCREDYAYGAAGSPPNIPPKATLVFEVELLDWEPEDLSGKSDKGIIRHIKVPGKGSDSPKEFSVVDVTLVGSLPDGKEFFNKRLSYSLGEGSKLDIPRGVEKALKHMVKEEKSQIDLKSKYAFGAEGNSKLGVPPDSSVSYTITLHNFEFLKEFWAINSTEKLEQANIFKEKGNKYLKDGDYSLAVKTYNKLVDYVEYDGGFDGNEEVERKKLLIAGYLNLSMTYLKVDNMVQCREMCNKALAQDPKSVKALFRRGQSFLGMKEPLQAMKDFKAVLEIEPQNKAAAAQVVICQQKAKEIKETEKKIYANMFDKFARKDQEWRYGWWEKDRPKVEESDLESHADVEIMRERKQEMEQKKKFIEMRLKKRKEEEEKAKLEESTRNLIEENTNANENEDNLLQEKINDPEKEPETNQNNIERSQVEDEQVSLNNSQ